MQEIPQEIQRLLDEAEAIRIVLQGEAPTEEEVKKKYSPEAPVKPAGRKKKTDSTKQ